LFKLFEYLVGSAGFEPARPLLNTGFYLPL